MQIPFGNKSIEELNSENENLDNCHIVRGSSVEIETGLILYGLARMNNSRVIIETGTSHCYSALHLAQAIKDNGGGMLYTIDKEQGETFRLDNAGLSNCYQSLIGDSVQVLSDLMPTLAEIDFVFLDANHAINHVADELRLTWPKLKVGGILTIHDVFNENMTPLCYSLQKQFPFMMMPNRPSVGIGIGQKIEDVPLDLNWERLL